jgi:hypothetical protein
MLIKVPLLVLCMSIAACGPRPRVDIMITNTPETIESCGKQIGGCR